jgi:hypothetical protein
MGRSLRWIPKSRDGQVTPNQWFNACLWSFLDLDASFGSQAEIINLATHMSEFYEARQLRTTTQTPCRELANVQSTDAGLAAGFGVENKGLVKAPYD